MFLCLPVLSISMWIKHWKDFYGTSYVINYSTCIKKTSDVVLYVAGFGVTFCTVLPSVCLDNI